MISTFATLIAAAALGSMPVPTMTITTSLHGKSCKILSFDRETGAATRQCRGVAGYDLLVHDEDGRASIDVAPRSRRTMPLNFWDVVSSGYTTVGRKAEWHLSRRNGKLVPIGLVVMVNSIEPAGMDGARHATLTTATRIGGEEACVVFRMHGATRLASQKARAALLDRRAPCLGAVES